MIPLSSFTFPSKSNLYKKRLSRLKSADGYTSSEFTGKPKPVPTISPVLKNGLTALPSETACWASNAVCTAGNSTTISMAISYWLTEAAERYLTNVHIGNTAASRFLRVKEGFICAFPAVEPYKTIEVKPDRGSFENRTPPESIRDPGGVLFFKTVLSDDCILYFLLIGFLSLSS